MPPESAEDAGGANLATSVKAKVKKLQDLQAQTEARAKEIEGLGAELGRREASLADRIKEVEQREKAQEEFLRTQSERVADLEKREEALAASDRSMQLELMHIAQQKSALAERERTVAEAERSLTDWLEPGATPPATADVKQPQEPKPDAFAAAPSVPKKTAPETAEPDRGIPPPPEVPEPPANAEAHNEVSSRPGAVAPSTTGRRAVIGRLNQAITIARKLKDEGHDVFEVRELLRNARAALDRMDYEEVALLTDAILEALASVKVR